MAGGVTDLARLDEVVQSRSREGRLIVAPPGAPGSGKPTLAHKLVAKSNRRRPWLAVVPPMDGFHYDDLYLVPAGLRQRKGARHTLDVEGLFHTLQRLRAVDEAEVFVPVFDRKIEIARARVRQIAASAGVIVVEGNWLLLEQVPWTRLRPLFDLKVMVDVPEAAPRSRLRSRWERLGLPEAAIIAELQENDMPNGRLERDESVT